MSKKELVTTQTRPVEEKHVTPIFMSGDLDYVTVVGSYYTWFVSDMIESNRGNKASFINQGIRQVCEYGKTAVGQGWSRRSVFLMFREDYEQRAINMVRQIVKDKCSADFAVYDNVSELLDFINRRPRKKRLLRQMDVFSHGMVGAIEFGYETPRQESYRLGKAQARMLNPMAFDDDAIIYSYACRTGVGADKSSFEPGDEPKYDESLAQVIADSADVYVMAYPRRSDYSDTYGTREDRERMQKTRKKMGIYKMRARYYESDLSAYEKKRKVYNDRLQAYRVAAGKPELQEIPNLPPPQPPALPPKDYTDADEILVMREDERIKNQGETGLPIDHRGAVRPVKSGVTPQGLPDGLKKFTPRERRSENA
jgi:hypothetical protein